MTCFCSRVGDGKVDERYTRHFEDHCCDGYCKRCARRADWARFKEDLAALLTREERCHKCKKARRISDNSKSHHQRQCWAHMEQRMMLALTF